MNLLCHWSSLIYFSLSIPFSWHDAIMTHGDGWRDLKRNLQAVMCLLSLVAMVEGLSELSRWVLQCTVEVIKPSVIERHHWRSCQASWTSLVLDLSGQVQGADIPRCTTVWHMKNQLMTTQGLMCPLRLQPFASACMQIEISTNGKLKKTIYKQISKSE